MLVLDFLNALITVFARKTKSKTAIRVQRSFSMIPDEINARYTNKATAPRQRPENIIAKNTLSHMGTLLFPMPSYIPSKISSTKNSSTKSNLIPPATVDFIIRLKFFIVNQKIK